VTPFFTIITPTIQRESLIECCKSVDCQYYTHWEHIVMVDRDPLNEELFKQIRTGPFTQRRVYKCAREHRNTGNTCRHNAYKYAFGRYVIYLDDDNKFESDRPLFDIFNALQDKVWPKVGLFPIVRQGARFINIPPRLNTVDTANVVIQTSIAQWPDRPEYNADGLFIEMLVREHSYVAFPEVEPIINNPRQSLGL